MWWNLVNSSVYGFKAESSIPPLYESDRYIFYPKEKADIFNEFLVSQTYLPIANFAIPTLTCSSHSSLCSIITSEEEVADILSQINMVKACGADGISNIMINHCMYGIVGHLHVSLIPLFLLVNFLIYGN